MKTLQIGSRVGSSGQRRMGTALLLVLGLTACGVPLSHADLEDDARFLSALPTQAQLTLQTAEDAVVSSGTSTGADVSSPCGLSGSAAGLLSDCDPDQYRTFTFRVAEQFNQTTLDMLTLLDRIREHPPTYRTEEARVWGPWQLSSSEGTWARLRIEWANPLFAYELRLGPRQDSLPDVVMAGVFAPGSTASEGEGDFSFDFTARSRYFPEQSRVGLLEASYSTLGDAVDLVVALSGMGEATSSIRVDQYYAWAAPGDGSGKLYFDTPLDGSGDGVPDHVVEIWSGWEEGGRGRADVRYESLEGVLLESGTECWAADQSVGYVESPSCGTLGEASSCISGVIDWNLE